MNIFARIFGKKPTSSSGDQAVIVHLDAHGLSDEVYEEHDLSTLEDQLIEAIESARVGEFDGNEFSEGVVTLYMYGPDAEKLFEVVEAPMRAYTLCAGAKVRIRSGEPGASEREIVLGTPA